MPRKVTTAQYTAALRRLENDFIYGGKGNVFITYGGKGDPAVKFNRDRDTVVRYNLQQRKAKPCRTK
jgi:hypothetical protein